MRAFYRAIITRPFLVAPFAICFLAAFIGPFGFPLLERLLAGWCLASAFYVISVSWYLGRMTTQDLSRRADDLDEGALTILALSMLSAAASFAGVVFELSAMHSHAGQTAVSLPLMVVTIVCSWFFIHTIFAIHYAHVFYNDGGHPTAPCLDFGNQDEEPDYWDFVYFSVAIGASSATSDTNIRSRLMRRLVAAHAIFSFFFNATVLALAINIAAGLLGGN
ncbi:DUF1345 domain-containing protein [Labrys monachus]|uniref:Membrane protein n=1 Tax=Labrys monachus TaxID=217067 RepID=A0ABU0FNJ2_9HYPH|nr:DUF1345 domain-containing protein [Labrys monachus]MDQ0396096.1 putative membrane protein [Labrys monachus]